jgi:ribose/xylose/arabinose/galactoside ABC-type transport system permease subunit
MVVLNISSYVQDTILGTVLIVAVVYDTLRRGGSFGALFKRWFGR